MRNLKHSVWLLLLLCSSLPASQRVDHVVTLWFKPEVPDRYVQQVIEQTRKLATIPGIEDLQVGSAVQSERPIVDDSFDLGITMRFSSKQAMREYLLHPRHKAFVEAFIKDKVVKLLVYDIQRVD